MKRVVILAAVGASALAMSACATRVNYEGFEPSSIGAGPMKTPVALICPDREGALTRTAQAGDGKSCDYQGADGETVRLKLLDLDGRSATEALAPDQAELRTLLPLPFKPVPAISKMDEGERTDVDLPFFHVHTLNDRSDVKIFGVSVHDDGKNTEVSVKKGGKHTIVHATPAGAEVLAEDVGRTNAELVYVLASDRRGPGGWRAVGYVAKGPTAGPLVVGEFRALERDQGERHHHAGNGDNGDLNHLIDRNLKS